MDLREISLACQLRRLYHLFELDPTTWKEIIAVEKPDEVSGGSDLEGEERSIPPVYFSDFVCDYP